MIETYRKRARFYDITANLFYLIGFRERHYRKQAVDMLQLKRGNTFGTCKREFYCLGVVYIGYGTTGLD